MAMADKQPQFTPGPISRRLVRWMLPHTAPAPLDLDHPVQADLAAAADEIELLRAHLASRAIRTMGPRSPFWNCTICGAAHLTPMHFQHKPDCLLADARLPVALWPEGRAQEQALREAAPALLAAFTEAVSFENEDTECLLGGPGHCDEHGEPNADDPCPDGRCRVHGCMIARINGWRALIAKATGQPSTTEAA